MAVTPQDLLRAQRLRYRVFVEELGGSGAGVDHALGIETDDFDPVCEHLLLLDLSLPEDDQVVGVYRLLDSARMAPGQSFYTDGEYDVAPLLASGRRLLELGRSCLRREYRGGSGLVLLWSELGRIVESRGIGILFGTASFHGTDIPALSEALSQLRLAHLSPEELRPVSRVYQPMDLVPEPQIDRVRAMKAVPALIKAYLRLGGWVGDGAYVDHEFNTTDVLLVLDAARISGRQRAIYSRPSTEPGADTAAADGSGG